MLKFTPLPPTRIALISTFRCTAACENCCFGCNPRQGRAMTLDEMKTYVDKCLETWPDAIKDLDITGGECMTIPDTIECIAEYATQRGLSVCILSNAFWATSKAKATKTLRRLADKGVKIVIFSSGDNHTRFVPFCNVRTAAVAAARIGLETKMRIEIHRGSTPLEKEINEDAELTWLINTGKIQLTYDEWMDFVKKGRTFKIDSIRGKKYMACYGLFYSVNINPYGEVYCCCGLPNSRIPYMRLGNINKEPIRDIYERAFDDVLKVWLRMKGPHDILQFVQDKTGWKFNWHTNHICDLCRIIMTDPRILPFLREHYYDYIEEMALHNVIYGK